MADDITFWKKAAQDNLETANQNMLEAIRLREALSKAKGYMLNAQIDLQTGARKKTALDTISGGLRLVEAALVLPDAPLTSEKRGGET